MEQIPYACGRLGALAQEYSSTFRPASRPAGSWRCSGSAADRAAHAEAGIRLREAALLLEELGFAQGFGLYGAALFGGVRVPYPHGGLFETCFCLFGLAGVCQTAAAGCRGQNRDCCGSRPADEQRPSWVLSNRSGARRVSQTRAPLSRRKNRKPAGSLLRGRQCPAFAGRR